PPHWRHHQLELIAERETVIDFSAQAVGDCSDPLAKAGIRIESIGKDPFKAHIVEQAGIRGLALNGKYELVLPRPVEQVDVLIAHFGRPPTLTAKGSGERLKAVAADRPRQVELLRLLGRGLDRIAIEAPADTILVQLACPAHTRDGNEPAKEAPKGG